jgi:class 3 adenylate cyclase/tetratricopeptide (TPR) repeat protein
LGKEGFVADREQIHAAIAAQATLRGVVSDELIDATVAALKAQLVVIEPDELADRRRQATVLFADVAGFTALSEGIDPEIIAGLMNELWLVLDAAIVENGGRVDKHIGDAVMGVWGVDRSREDDPERAVRAALALRQRFEAFRGSRDLPIGIRVGVNTGPVMFGRVGVAGEHSVTGDAVNVASRLEHAAPHGEILISHGTYGPVRGVFDVRELDPLTVKGKSDPLRCYAVSREKERAFRRPNRGVEGLETRLIGREAELDAVRAAYQQSTETGSAQSVLVVGEAGAGKSRLLQEFTEWLDLQHESIYYLKGRCFPDLASVPLGLFKAMFSSRFGIKDDDDPVQVAEKLRSGFGVLSDAEADVTGHWIGFDLADSDAVEKLAGSAEFGTIASAYLARYLRYLLDDAPLVMVLEDVHWADQESLDAVTRLISKLGVSRLLVVMLARPSFVAAGSLRADDSTQSSVVRLEGLTDREVRSLVSDILRRLPEIPDVLMDMIVERSDGNPFYIEELIKVMIDDGVIVVPDDDGSWSVTATRLEELAVPPTLEGVLQARLDSLHPERRRTLQYASVIGRTFWDSAVVALEANQTSGHGAEVTEALGELTQREMVWRNPQSSMAGSTEFRFKHALLRDAAYETILLRDRQQLHALAADWLETQAGARLDEYLGLIAEHLEKSTDIDGAVEFHERAGAKSMLSGSLGAARVAYERALALRTRGGTEHSVEAARIRLDLGRVLEECGELNRATAEYRMVESDATDHHPDLLVLAQVGLVRVATIEGDWSSAAEMVGRAELLAERVGGSALVRFRITKAWILSWTGQFAIAVEVAELALELSRTLGDTADELDVLITLAGAHNFDGGSEDKATEMYLQAMELARDIGNVEREAILMGNLAVLAHIAAGVGEEHRLDEAIELYRTAYLLQEQLGTRGAITTLGNLAQALVEAGRLDEASKCAHRALRDSSAQRLAGDRAIAVIVHGQIAMARGDVALGLAIFGAIEHDGRSSDVVAQGELARVLAAYDIPDDEVAAGMKRGSDRDLDELVVELLAEK